MEIIIDKIRQKIVMILLDLLWRLADEITFSSSCMHEIYDDVPEDLKNEVVDEYHICCYSSEKREKIIKWLDEAGEGWKFIMNKN